MNTIDFTEYNKPPFWPQFLQEPEPLALVKIADTECGLIDTNTVAVANSLEISTATGIFLDRAGKILAVKRNGKSDPVFKTALQIKAILNHGNGNVETIIQAVKFLYEATVVTITPNYPASLTITHNGRSTLDALEPAYFSDGSQIGFTDGDYMIFSSPDYTIDDLMASVFAAGVAYTITKI